MQQALSTAPAGTEPGLEADYPLNDGQGQTAVDLTSNQDGTLAGLNGVPRLGRRHAGSISEMKGYGE